MIKDFSGVKTYIDKISSPLLDDVQIAREPPRYLYAASGWSRAISCSQTNYVPANKLQLVLKVRTPFDPDNSVISL